MRLSALRLALGIGGLALGAALLAAGCGAAETFGPASSGTGGGGGSSSGHAAGGAGGKGAGGGGGSGGACGALGEACCAGEKCGATLACKAGACRPAPVNACGDTTSDPENCGACGKACPTGAACDHSACVCPGKGEACGGACVDTPADPKNCGACGKVCATGATCLAGACTCPGAEIACGGACVDPKTDLGACGGCGKACPQPANTTATCAVGVCGQSCTAGHADCDQDPADGCEADLQTDPTNCGSCGHGCEGAACKAGACQPLCLGVASAGPPAWSGTYGDASAQSGLAVATDPSGNVLATGGFNGSMTLGNVTLTSAGSTDVFVAKLDPAGNVLWAKRFGDAKAQSGAGIATDAAGNVYVAGSFLGSISFGGPTLASAGCCFNDVFLAKLDASGNHLWSAQYGDAADQVGRAVTVDPQGNVLLAGSFEGTLTFGATSLASAGDYDAFVAKLDPTGASLWSRALGGPDAQSALALATDAAGNVVLTGDAATSIDLGQGALAVPGTTGGWVAVLGAAGAPTWGKLFGDATTSGTAAGFDAAGNVHLAGDFTGNVDLGGGTLAAPLASRIFVAELDPQGNHLWSRAFGDDAAHHVTGLAVDPLGRTVVAGFFQGSIDFGGGPLASAGNYDIFLARLDPTGCQVWSRRFGDPGYQSAAAVATDAQGSAVITGDLQGTVDFGGGALVAQGGDFFLAKFGE